jgi:hypothetical protein
MIFKLSKKVVSTFLDSSLITPHVLCGNLYRKIVFWEFGGHLELCFLGGSMVIQSDDIQVIVIL